MAVVVAVVLVAVVSSKLIWPDKNLFLLDSTSEAHKKQ